ncbi:MAG: class I SAM-dependent methyltransferase [Alphaproteobacteria bacterium]
MTETTRHDAWQAGESYDRYMGRWSRRLAPRFLDWLAAPEDRDWLDVGCGTGALSSAILAACRPRRLCAIDPSAGFLAQARASVRDDRITFEVGDAQALAVDDASVDVVASALALNFVPDRAKALSEMRRVTRPGGIVGFYVWDYPGGGIGFMRAFWTAAAALDPAAADLTEDRRFPFCTETTLVAMVRDAGLVRIASTAIEAPTVFADFDDYWRPFTLGAGPAPGYCASLPADARERLRRRLDADLPRAADGSIAMTARAWAVKATVP